MDRTTVQKSTNTQSFTPMLMSDFRLAIGSPMHTISKKLSKQENYFAVASGTSPDGRAFSIVK